MPTIKRPKQPPLSNESISRQFELLTANPDFRATPQQVAILKYVVNQTLAGNAHRIKGTTAATEVLGRGADFNQSIDPVVNIRAGRLRRAIDWFDHGAGARA